MQRFSTFSRELSSWRRSISAFDIYEQFINIDVLIKLLVQQSSFDPYLSGKNFLTSSAEMKTWCQLVSTWYHWCQFHHGCKPVARVPMLWDCDNFVGNAGIQNNFTRTRYQEDLQNLYFVDNTRQNKTDII